MAHTLRTFASIAVAIVAFGGGVSCGGAPGTETTESTDQALSGPVLNPNTPPLSAKPGLGVSDVAKPINSRVVDHPGTIETAPNVVLPTEITPVTGTNSPTHPGVTTNPPSTVKPTTIQPKPEPPCPMCGSPIELPSTPGAG